MTGDSTKNRILDAAESLFAVNGFGWTSLRMITKEAGANLAAIHYHFGSKEALIEAVCARRADPLNRERLRLLDEIERNAGDGSLPLEELVEAFVGPALRMCLHPEMGGGIFPRLLSHAMVAPREEIRDIVHRLFDEVVRRFTAAFGRALPELAHEELRARIHFMVGAMLFSLAIRHLGAGSPERECVRIKPEAAVEPLVHFVVWGMKAPSAFHARSEAG